MMGLTSIVTNYRTPQDLEEFLASFAAYPALDQARLVVVNVEPGPADLAVVERWRERIPDMGAISFADNVGYARACNRAASIDPNGDVLAFFNADVVLRPDALTECYEAIQENRHWGALGPRQVDQHNRITASGVYGPPTQPAFAAWLDQDQGQCSAVRDDALTVSGSAYFIRRSVWELMTACPAYQAADPGSEGGFLQTPHYWEETFLSGHLRFHGYKIGFLGSTVIVHKWHRASPHGGLGADRHMSASRAIYRAACDAHQMAHE